MNDLPVETINLWSERWTFAHGWHWKYERTCHIETSEQWLEVFQKDEPLIKFKLSKTKPKACKK